MTGPPESPRPLLAGRPGSGKTTAVARLVELPRADGLVVDGFLYRVDDQHYVRDGHPECRRPCPRRSTSDAEVVQLRARR